MGRRCGWTSRWWWTTSGRRRPTGNAAARCRSPGACTASSSATCSTAATAILRLSWARPFSARRLAAGAAVSSDRAPSPTPRRIERHHAPAGAAHRRVVRRGWHCALLAALGRPRCNVDGGSSGRSPRRPGRCGSRSRAPPCSMVDVDRLGAPAARDPGRSTRSCRATCSTQWPSRFSGGWHAIYPLLHLRAARRRLRPGLDCGSTRS